MTPPADQVHGSGFRARIKRARRNARRRVNRALTRLFGTMRPAARPLDPNTRRILVVRLNKRLGNILFLTPLLRTLAASLPTASIDVLIQDARQKPLLETLPGIGTVWVQGRSLPAMLRLMRRLRARRYDLAIDPTGNSSSNRLAVALSGARQRMGFASRDQWLKLTHAAPRARSRHQAQQSVELVTHSTRGHAWQTFSHLAVSPAEAAERSAHEHWTNALGTREVREPVIGFFRHATGRKRLDEAWWQAFVSLCTQRLPQARLLEIRPPGSLPRGEPDIAEACIDELDVLAALLSRLDAFVAADSGPMHLAAAAGVPVVGLFKATDPTAYAPLGSRCRALSGDALDATYAVAAIADILQRDPRTSAA